MNIIYTYYKPVSNNAELIIKHKLYKRFSSTNSNVNNYKIIGKTRHFPFATKEWKDSVYTYNKNSLRVLPVNNKLTDDLLKSYFTMSSKNIARSRRMRSLKLRSSSKVIILSRPEIKQTNDKIIVTIYSYNRQKQNLVRKLYFFNRKQNIYNLWLNNHFGKKITNKKAISSKKLVNKYTLFSGKSFKNFKNFKDFKTSNVRMPYNNINFKNETNFLKFRFMRLYKRFFVLNSNFIFSFLEHLLFLFRIEIFYPSTKNTVKGRTINSWRIKNILKNKPKLLIAISNKSNSLKLVKQNDINLKSLESIITKHKYINQNKKLNQEKINYFLWNFIKTRIINSNVMMNRYILSLFVKLKSEYFNKMLAKYFRRKIKILRYYTRLEIDTLKFSVLLNNLKDILSKIYDKNTELNIINLKYFHLNSDIYTKVVAKKLTKKVKTLKVLHYSFKSIKLPNEWLFMNRNNSNINDLQSLNTFKSVKLTDLNFGESNSPYNITDNSDKLNHVFNKLFPNGTVHHKQELQPLIKGLDHSGHNDENKPYRNNKIVNILNTIKYKWIKGIKVAIAGRLTRRNTAARSLKKYITKGNLNDIQYYWESNELKHLSKVILRNNIKANLQYTSSKSKRRTGAFGVKSWISSY